MRDDPDTIEEHAFVLSPFCDCAACNELCHFHYGEEDACLKERHLHRVRGWHQMIVKCQWPLATSGEPTILLYDRERKFQRVEAVTPEWKRLFGGRLKIYAQAHFAGSVLVIDRVVEDQPW